MKQENRREAAGRAVGRERLSREDVAYAAELTLSCLISYTIITRLLAPFVEASSDLLGGMWAVVATAFVFRYTRDQSLSAGLSRLQATCVSFVLCFGYLVIWPFSPVGMALLIGLGAIAMMLLGRREDIVTTSITTAVVMVVAGLSPRSAWAQPIPALWIPWSVSRWVWQSRGSVRCSSRLRCRATAPGDVIKPEGVREEGQR